jgi:DnaJ-class molecular chaperone
MRLNSRSCLGFYCPNMNKLHTHYDNLKVARDAPPEVIKAAYKTLCHKFHPDRHAGSEWATHTFQLINSAYEVLSDPVRRSHHDAWITKQEATYQHMPPTAVVTVPSESEQAWRVRYHNMLTAIGHAWRGPNKQKNRLTITAVLWVSISLLGVVLFILHHL